MAKRNGENLAELNIPVQIIDFSKVDAQLEKLRLKIEGNGTAIDRFGRTAKQSFIRAMQSTNEMLQSMQRAEASSRRIGSLWSSIKFGAGAGIGVAAVQKLEAGIRRIPSLLVKSVVDSSALKSTERRLQRTFGSLTDDARSFAKDFSAQVGTAESATKDKLARFAASLERTGIAPEKRLEAAKTMTRLSSDLATAFGTSEDDASMAMLAALRGEADPIERFGLNLHEAAVNAKLLEMGVAGGSRAATEAQKVIARLNVIIAQTSNIHGEATRSTDTFTRETSKLGATWQSFSEKIGAALEPSAAHLARFLNETLTQVESTLGPVDELGDRFLATAQKWTEALGPMREKFVEFVATLPESVASVTNSLASLREELSFVGDAIEGIGKRMLEVESLKGSIPDYVRGRMRQDDAVALVAGSKNVNKLNRDLKDLSSTRTTTQQERDEQIAKARIPTLKRMAFVFEDVMSTILGITHGKTPEPPRKGVAGPAPETEEPETGTTAAKSEQPAGRPVTTTPATSMAGMRSGRAASETAASPGQPTLSEDTPKTRYEEINPRNAPMPRNPWLEWSRKALEATTGIKVGPPTKPAEKTPADEVFGQTKTPFERVGEAIGSFAGAVTPHTAMSTALRAKISQLESELMRPQVSFVGLQGVQQHVQAAIGQSEDREKREQLELLKKQLEAEQRTESRLERLPTDIARSLRPLMGLQ